MSQAKTFLLPTLRGNSLKTAVLDMGKLFLPFVLGFLLLVFASVLLGGFLGMTSRKPSIAGAVALLLLSAPGY